jgi:TonB family protein
MILKIFAFTAFYLFVVFSLFSQDADTATSVLPDSGDTSYLDGNSLKVEENPDQQIEMFAKKYDFNLEKGISSKMLSDGIMHIEPNLNSPETGVVIKQNEKVYAFKYFANERSWLIKYKSNWGFVEDFIVMAVKEEKFTSYKDQWDIPPKIKTSIKPKYTKEMKDAGLEGNVELKVYISDKGVVDQTIILKGIDGLNDAAIKAVNNAKFEPAKKNGAKIGVWVPMRINF